MRSHTYELTVRDLIQLICPTLGLVALCAAGLHLAAWLDWLPQRPLTLQADETVLRHQAKASRTRHPAAIVLIGDSTCHAGVDAAALSRQLPERTRAINLGLIIGIDFSLYGQIAADFSATNPDQIRWVVLLITPTRLANRGERDFWLGLRDEVQSGRQRRPFTVSLQDISGARLFRERLASGLLPEPLRGRGASLFGFTTELDRYMTAHEGSVVDVGEMQPRPTQPPAEFPVGEDFASAGRDFRAFLPKNVKLAVGLTPSPAFTAGPAMAERYRETLQRLEQLLSPDVLLTNLPATLPVPCFSPSAHLNLRGQQQFTTALAKELSGLP